MRHVIVRVRSLAFGAVTCLVFSGCEKSGTTDSPSITKPALSVELISPAIELWPDEIVANGRIEAWQESVISSETGGFKLTEVFVETGDEVTEGQVLAAFDEEMIRARLMETEAALRSREAIAAISKDALERSRKLVTSGAVSEETFRQQEMTAEKDIADLASARAQLSARQLELRHAQVIAPDKGVISSRSATVGTAPTPGSELFTFIRQSRLEWRAEIPVRHSLRVAIGQSAILATEGNNPTRGVVRKISPTIERKNLTMTCYIDLPENNGLKPGMFLNGTILTGESPAIHLPESSLIFRDGSTYISKVGDDMISRLIKVTVQRRRNDFVDISGDFSKDDKVILSGGAFLNEGDHVRVIHEGGQR